MNQTVVESIREAIEQAIEGADVAVDSGVAAGHYNIQVKSVAFAGKSMVETHRMVYSAIAHLMAGDAAAVHAIDRLRTVAA